MDEKTRVLSREKTNEIVSKLLVVFKNFTSNVKLYYLFDHEDYIYEDKRDIADNSNPIIMYKWDENMKDEVEILECNAINVDDNAYYVICNNGEYLINFYTSPNECGYHSILEDYCDETYIFCCIKEIYKMEDIYNIRYEISFGFNILNMEFLELFNVSYINKNGYIRECKEIQIIEKEFVGKNLCPDSKTQLL